jgi:hypothetical protein
MQTHCFDSTHCFPRIALRTIESGAADSTDYARPAAAQALANSARPSNKCWGFKHVGVRAAIRHTPPIALQQIRSSNQLTAARPDTLGLRPAENR